MPGKLLHIPRKFQSKSLSSKFSSSAPTFFNTFPNIVSLSKKYFFFFKNFKISSFPILQFLFFRKLYLLFHSICSSFVFIIDIFQPLTSLFFPSYLDHLHIFSDHQQTVIRQAFSCSFPQYFHILSLLSLTHLSFSQSLNPFAHPALNSISPYPFRFFPLTGSIYLRSYQCLQTYLEYFDPLINQAFSITTSFLYVSIPNSIYHGYYSYNLLSCSIFSIAIFSEVILNANSL